MILRVAVIGGGITGLAAAYEVRQLAPDATIVVFEAADRLGGKLLTTDFDGTPVDEAADAFLARVPYATDLCDELGLTPELVSPATGSAFVWSDGALRRLPSSTLLGVPTDLDDLAATGIVSAEGMARARTDLDRDDPPLVGDVAIGPFVRDRLGDEITDKLVAPLVGGINAGDAEVLSLRACAAQIAAAADQGGSLMRAAAELRSKAVAGAPVFLGPREGMGVLVDRVAAATGAEILLHTPVAELSHRRRGLLVNGESFDVAIVATPAPIAAELLTESEPAAALLRAIPHVSVALATFGFAPEQVAHPLDGSGMLVPAPEGRFVTACSFASTKWAHLARDDRVLFRVSAGRDGDQRVVDLSDTDVVAGMLADLADFVGISGEPTAVRLSRWNDSFPQYRPGHLDRIDELDTIVAAEMPDVAVAGCAERGVGVPACIHQGRTAARRLLSP